ncbi:MAG TPA: NifU family protein [Actinomycetota bacterium]|nr:NifU family protein [Actinomycetota bacterium]
MAEGRDVGQTGQRIESLLEELRQAGGPDVWQKAEQLVRLLVDLYGAGLTRIVEVLREAPGGEEVLRRLAEEPAVAGLLLVHDLHPIPLEERVQGALDRVRPYLGSHAGGVEFLGVDEAGVVRLRLKGSCHGCPSSVVTVKLALERAVQEAAPEVAGVEVEGMVEAAGPSLLQVAPLGAARREAPSPEAAGGWVVLEGLHGLLPGETRAVEPGGVPVLLCSAEGHLYAYRNRCPGCGGELTGARLEGRLLRCGCGERYDVQLAGRSPDREDLHLEPLPLLPERGGWKVALPTGVGS